MPEYLRWPNGRRTACRTQGRRGRTHLQREAGAKTDRVALAKAIAALERSLILARTGEGRIRAMARGIKFGRPSELTDHQITEARKRRDAGEALAEIGRTYNVSHSTISRL
jgi:DNA invertase Pin-like site-specific DNA recombinase